MVPSVANNMNGAPIARNGCLSAADGSYVCNSAASGQATREGFLAPPKPTLPAAAAVPKLEPFYSPGSGSGSVVSGMKSALAVLPRS